jgi:hypothetical protein
VRRSPDIIDAEFRVIAPGRPPARERSSAPAHTQWPGWLVWLCALSLVLELIIYAATHADSRD